MAPRLAVLADRTNMRTWWNTYKATLPEFTIEPALTLAMITRWWNNPRYFFVIDTVAKSMGIFITHDNGMIEGSLFATAAATNKAREIKRIGAFGLRVAQSRGFTKAFGNFLIAAGTENGALVAFYESSPFTVTKIPVKGGVLIHIEADLEAVASDFEVA